MGQAQRETWIDSAKGLTITLVVLHHVFVGMRAGTGFGEEIIRLYEMSSPIRMPLFFLIAGFFARKSISGDLHRFVDGKLLHFSYFYLLWSIISILIRSSLSQASNNEVHSSQILQILWDPPFTLWFLYALFLSFLIARMTANAPVFIQIILSSLIAMAAKDIFPEDNSVLFRTLELYPFFIIGVYGSRHIREWISGTGATSFHSERSMSHTARTLIIILLGSLLYASLVAIAYKYGSIQRSYFYYPLAAISSLTILHFMFLIRSSYISSMFLFVGERSLYVYLLHFLPAAGSRIVGVRLGLADHPGLIVISGTVASVIFCIVTYEVVKRMPVAKFMFQRPSFLMLPGKAGSAPAG